MPSLLSLLLNPIVAAQNFEYKIANTLDNPLQSSFGFVSETHWGWFSAYRRKAIIGRPLEQLFVRDQTYSRFEDIKGIFERNVIVADANIPGVELVAKKGESWTLRYIRSAKGDVDMPERVEELLSLKRREINGSFAEGVYALSHFVRLLKSSHGVIRKMLFLVQTLYRLALLIFDWLKLANAWLTFKVVLDSMAQQKPIFGKATEDVNAGRNSSSWQV